MQTASDLDAYLRAQLDEAQTDSSGSFTLAEHEAIRKLAGFALERDTAWILKVVQAAVASGSQALRIRLTSEGADFKFLPTRRWTNADFRRCFADPQPDADPALELLKHGLWNISLHHGHPFSLSMPDHDQALIWTGSGFAERSTEPTTAVHLSVSHRSLQQGKGILLLRDFHAAQRNSALLKEVSHFAYTAPLHLTVDGRPLAALQLCPTHGSNASSMPFALGWTERGGEPLPLPPATWGRYRVQASPDEQLAADAPLLGEPSAKIHAALMVSLEYQRVGEGQSSRLQACRRPSILHWVSHGVLIGRTQLALPESCVAGAVFASTHGLPTDLSGLQMVRSVAALARKQEVCSHLAPCFAHIHLALPHLVHRRDDFTRKLGIGTSIGGLLFGVTAGVVDPALAILGVVAAGSGVAALTSRSNWAGQLFNVGQSERDLENSFQTGLHQLKEAWIARAKIHDF